MDSLFERPRFSVERTLVLSQKDSNGLGFSFERMSSHLREPGLSFEGTGFSFHRMGSQSRGPGFSVKRTGSHLRRPGFWVENVRILSRDGCGSHFRGPGCSFVPPLSVMLSLLLFLVLTQT